MRAFGRKSKESLLRILLVGAVQVVVFGFVATPNASADTFTLNQIFCNCLPAGSTAGSVTVTQNGANSITVTVQLNAGLAFHDQGLDSFVFNSSIALTGANFALVNGGGGTWSFGPATNADGAGIFQYAVNCTGGSNGCVGLPSTLVFTLNATGITPASIEIPSNHGVDFAANIAVQGATGCTGMVGGGNGTGQSTPSGGFTGTSPCVPTPPPSVPEPASLLLLGTGLAMAGYRLKPRSRKQA